MEDANGITNYVTGAEEAGHGRANVMNIIIFNYLACVNVFSAKERLKTIATVILCSIRSFSSVFSFHPFSTPH